MSACAQPCDIRESNNPANFMSYMNTVSIQKYAENIQLSEDAFKNNTFPTTT